MGSLDLVTKNTYESSYGWDRDALLVHQSCVEDSSSGHFVEHVTKRVGRLSFMCLYNNTDTSGWKQAVKVCCSVSILVGE